MITCVIGLSGFLLDDEAFGIARSTWDLPIDVIFAIATRRQPSFAIPKMPSSDITWKRCSVPLLKLGQQIMGFLRNSSFERFPRSGGGTFSARR